MNGSSWRRVLLAGYGLLAACMTPVSVAAQGSGPSGTPSIYLRTPQPTPRLVVKQRLDELLATVVAAPQADDQRIPYDALSRIADAYSAFGYPAEAWGLFSQHRLERGQALEILANDGNVSFVSDILAGIPESDPKKCDMAEQVAAGLDRNSRDIAAQFRARHGCIRAKRPTGTPLPSALDELRTHVGVRCQGAISTKNDCRMLQASMVRLFLLQTSGTPAFALALREVSKIEHMELRARVLWVAMIGLARIGRVQELHDTFAMIQAIATEGGALAVISEVASGQVEFSESVCLLESTFKPSARPVLAGRPISPGFDDCGRAIPKTMILSTVLALQRGGHIEFARKIFDWYQTISVAAADSNQPSSKRRDAAGSNPVAGPTDIVGLAITHAYMGNADVARGLLRRYDPGTQALDSHNVFWLAFLGLDEVLPAAFRRAQSQSDLSWRFACAWLRGRALKDDASGVLQIARLMEPNDATHCLADALSMAPLNGLHVSEDMAGLVLAKDSPFRPSTSRVWTKYTASLIASNFDAIAQRAMAAGLEDGFVPYSYDLDKKEHREAWDGVLETLTTELFMRGHGALVRSLLPRAPSDTVRSLIVLRLAGALADQGLWKELSTTNEWADLSRVPYAAEYEAPWNIIARNYGRAGDMEMVFKLIQHEFIGIHELGNAVSAWRSGGRLVGP